MDGFHWMIPGLEYSQSCLTPGTPGPTLPTMARLTFDTLKFVHRLRESGIPETQA